MAAPNGDLEAGIDSNGRKSKDSRRISYAPDVNAPVDGEKQDEYSQLVRYISTYRDASRAGSEAGDDDDKPKKKRFWQSKAKDAGGLGFETPDEWLTTPMGQGLKTSDIEPRRKKAGWNELTTEKENLFIKFLMFFTGPILYGS